MWKTEYFLIEAQELVFRELRWFSGFALCLVICEHWDLHVQAKLAYHLNLLLNHLVKRTEALL